MKNVNKLIIILFTAIGWNIHLSAGVCDTVCQATPNKLYYVTGVSDATTYTWSAASPITIVSGQGNDSVFLNFTGVTTSGVYNIMVTPSNACGDGAKDTLSIYVQATPGKPNAGADQSVCVGSGMTLTATGMAGAVFRWIRPNGTSFTGASLSIPATVLADSGNYIVFQTVNGCISALADTVLGVVNTNPGAANSTTSTAAICEMGTKALTGTPVGGSWAVVSGGGSIAGTTYTPANVAVNTQVIVSYTIPANGACASTSNNDTFQVDFQNIAAGTTPKTAICETGTKTLVGAPAGGTWAVVSGGGSVAGSTYTPANVAANTQVIVQYTSAINGTCPSTTDNDTFQVDFQNIAIGSTDTTAICEATTKTLVGAPASGTWVVVSGGGSVAGSTYTPANVASRTQVIVQYLSAVNGTCPGTTDNDTFAVKHNPIISGFTTVNPTTCLGSNGSITLNGLDATTSHTVSYTGTPAPSNPYTTNGSGQLVISSLPSGTYSNIRVTLSGCDSNTVGPATLTGNTPTGTPTINCN